MKHGEEGTHSVCDARLRAERGDAMCCVCVPHDNCSLEAQNSPSQSNQVPMTHQLEEQRRAEMFAMQIVHLVGRIQHEKVPDDTTSKAFVDIRQASNDEAIDAIIQLIAQHDAELIAEIKGNMPKSYEKNDGFGYRGGWNEALEKVAEVIEQYQHKPKESE